MIRDSARGETNDLLFIPWELLQSARESRLGAHDRRERLILQKVSTSRLREHVILLADARIQRFS